MSKLTVLLIAVIVSEVVMATAMASSWKFAVLADSRAMSWDDNGLGVAANTLGILVNDIKSQGVDLVIYPGDMVSGTGNLSNQLDSWKSVMMPLTNAGIPVYTLRGNHEGDSDMMPANYELFLEKFPLKDVTSPDGGFTYSFTHKNAEFIGFDQFINQSGDFNLTLFALHSNQGQMMNRWVTNQINSSISPLNFGFANEMLFPSESHPDCMANDPDSRDALVAALGTHHGTYLCGHDHMYLRGTASDGNGHTVPELVVGTAGGGNYDYSPINASGYTGPDTFTADKNYGDENRPYFGYLLVTVNDDNSWAGEFKAFQYDTYEEGKPHNAGPIQTMDRFRTGQMSNCSQVVVELASSSAEKAAEKPAAMQPGFEGFLAIMGLSVMGYLSLVRKQ